MPGCITNIGMHCKYRAVLQMTGGIAKYGFGRLYKYRAAKCNIASS